MIIPIGVIENMVVCDDGSIWELKRNKAGKITGWKSSGTHIPGTQAHRKAEKRAAREAAEKAAEKEA